MSFHFPDKMDKLVILFLVMIASEAIRKKGLGDVVWAVTKHKYDGKKPHIVFTYTSPDGDQGFPGELIVTVTYKLVKNNELSVVMEAKPKDKATSVNLAHHTYWNLGGHNAGDILSEEIQILGSSYTPVDGELIPTGQISPVKGTPYDFSNSIVLKII
ncbi:unnamed protein product [Eruca vesicaria subsp. sativa]|uniref:Uncharacterized protein n=1 Tax=Eruca vesicaria subsp. sativa TaxID=29727 RepID=A0ABC8JH67_ERUVS|nr:unnamed protein product [Eruca vesicaria subsp. sativa]